MKRCISLLFVLSMLMPNSAQTMKRRFFGFDNKPFIRLIKECAWPGIKLITYSIPSGVQFFGFGVYAKNYLKDPKGKDADANFYRAASIFCTACLTTTMLRNPLLNFLKPLSKVWKKDISRTRSIYIKSSGNGRTTFSYRQPIRNNKKDNFLDSIINKLDSKK